MGSFLPIDWRDLQNRLAEDDQEALKVLYDHYNHRLFELAYAIVRSKEMAEEVVGDVFIKIWQKRSGLRSIDNLSFYLYVMTKNGSRSYLRKYGRTKHINLDELALPLYRIDSTPEDLMISEQALRHINSVINELPPQMPPHLQAGKRRWPEIPGSGRAAPPEYQDRREPDGDRHEEDLLRY